MAPLPSFHLLARQSNESLAVISAVSAMTRTSSPSMGTDTITNIVFGIISVLSACVSIWQVHRYSHASVGSQPTSNRSSLSCEIPQCARCPSYHDQLSRSGSDIATLVEPTEQTAAEQDSSLRPESPALNSQKPCQSETRDDRPAPKIESGTSNPEHHGQSWKIPHNTHGEDSDDSAKRLVNSHDYTLRNSASFRRLSLPSPPKAYLDSMMLPSSSSAGWPGNTGV
ncbi:hypothetical protein AOQ84DRAFT_18029 [Glonium stellatum]|uniref:Uncharacterized protein n=1 Tax=Glonium stellatum TaxID=574774 RepID=A0A8E2JL59_9PEZI|nr:hypothetical protein AOQ84DRAFT_18029 [Glonium stellatum]